MLKTSTAGVLVLAFCATATPASAQETPKPKAPSNAPPMPADVRPMEEPKAASAGSVTLAEAVRRALERNPTAEIAHQEVVRSIALARQVRAAWFPTLVGNGTYTHLDGDRVSNGTVLTPQDSVAANLS